MRKMHAGERARSPHTRRDVEVLEDRLVPAWAGVGQPPAAVVPIRLDALGDSRGFADLRVVNEVDWYRLAAPAAGQYRVSVQSAAGSLGPLVAIYTEQGRRLAVAGQLAATIQQLTVPLQAGRRYFVAVAGARSQPIGRHVWHIDGPMIRPDDRYEENDRLAQAANLGVVRDGVSVGRLALQDRQDWFRFQVTASPGSDARLDIRFRSEKRMSRPARS
jgi:hypothetical protein